ncbi:MAG: hypothetical protein QXN37_00200 [Candidatus Anstonellaceae archaeon]
MKRFLVLVEGFESLSYPLGKEELPAEFEYNKEKFFLVKVADEFEAQALVAAAEDLKQHAVPAVGYVFSEGKFYLVCMKQGKKPNAAEMSPQQRLSFAILTVRRLAAIHSQGLCCGGLPSDAIEFSGKQVLLSQPNRLCSEVENHEMFFEAAATLGLLKSNQFVLYSQLRQLASEYVSFSPICRHTVYSYVKEKGLSLSPTEALAQAAAKYSLFF